MKLDKEVGGGDLAELCTITMLIVYPYAGTINFEICTQNTPTSNSNNFSNNQPNSACDLSCRANKQNKEREGAHRGESSPWRADAGERGDLQHKTPQPPRA